MKNLIRTFKQILPLSALITSWQIFIIFYPEKEFFFGSPLGILYEAKHAFTNQTLLKHFYITAFEATTGFILGVICGTVFGILLWTIPNLYDFAKMFLLALGAIPIFALGPIFIFWFGTGIFSKIVLSFLSVFLLACKQSYSAVNNVSNDFINLVKTFGGSKTQLLNKILIPSSMIWVLESSKINVNIALLGAFIGEFISSNIGLGHFILVAEGLYNINQIWLGIVAIIILSAFLQLFVHIIEKKILFWR